jgi:hypothetical protein
MVAAVEVGKAVSAPAVKPCTHGYGKLKWLAACAMFAVVLPVNADTYCLTVAGLGGEPAYEQRFREQAATLAEAARKLTGDPAHALLLSGEHADRDSIRRELRALAAKLRAEDEVIVTLIGHGSFDGDEYRFNIPGPDITASELLSLFDQLPAGNQLIVNATSASGAAIERWQRENRIVISATKSGGERNATRFAEFWVQALSSPGADLNKDEIVTAKEAFDYASRKVADVFKADVALATEHARLEGHNAERFQVARFGAAARVTANPELNEMFAQRVRIERDIEAVKARKAALTEDEYYNQLELVLVRLALLQRNIDSKSAALEGDAARASPGSRGDARGGEQPR